MVKKSTVVLFGSSDDSKMKERSRKLKASGRNVQIQQSTTHPDGTGHCGQICSCKMVCSQSAVPFGVVESRITDNQGVFKSNKGFKA